MSQPTNCVFCSIIKGQSPETVIHYENDDIVIFSDIKPASDHHYLVVPKIHIESAKVLSTSDLELLNKMEATLKEFISSKNLDLKDTLFGFHWPPFITVSHLHMHGICPASNMGFISKGIFRADSLWFRSPNKVREYINSK